MRDRGVPDVMPTLQVGRHRRPRDGACVMEYVSMLAGERFSDGPRCVDLPLAALARTVNDRLGDDMRQALGTRAVDMIDTDQVGDEVRLRAAVAVFVQAGELMAAPNDQFLVAVATLGLARAAAANRVDVTDDVRRVLRTVEDVAGPETLGRACRFAADVPVEVRRYVDRALPAALSGVACRAAGEGAVADAGLLSLLDAALAVYVPTRSDRAVRS